MSYAIAFNRQDKSLVTAWADSPTPITSKINRFFYTDYFAAIIYVLDPTGMQGNNPPYIQPDLSTFTLQVAIGRTLKATTPDAPIIVGNFTWNATFKYFEGNLAFTDTAIRDAIGINTNTTFWLEVTLLSAGGVPQVVYETSDITNVAIWASLNPGSTTPPPGPPATYPTTAQGDARWVLKVGRPGEAIILNSLDGTQWGELSWGNDGQFHANAIPAPI